MNPLNGNDSVCHCGGRAEVVIETMPIHLRDSHDEARNRGIYPCNGAERYLACRDCAEFDVAADPEWTEVVS